MKNLLVPVLVFCAVFIGLSLNNKTNENAPNVIIADIDNYFTTYNAPYFSDVGEELTHPTKDDIQCPIPMEDRVKNGTGIQCVWSSIEMIGRWAEEPKLMNPPLTSRGECKSYSGPSLAAKVLNSLNVKFEQSYQDSTLGIQLIKKAMRESRGCLFGVPGHAMALVHYDEVNNVVKWVDNSDQSLKVQTMTVERFKQRWDTWVLVVYADNDIIPQKMHKIPNIPIRDHNQPNRIFDENHVPIPYRR